MTGAEGAGRKSKEQNRVYIGHFNDAYSTCGIISFAN
jgi:hypothetical protein